LVFSWLDRLHPTIVGSSALPGASRSSGSNSSGAATKVGQRMSAEHSEKGVKSFAQHET
jgi:hypothetical protein